jgi:hypothetical protein
LASATIRNESTSNLSVIIGDLLGYYTIISGDLFDTQVFDNTATLPRYTDGVGVIASLMNNVSGATAAGIATVTYVDTNDVTCTTTFRTNNTATQNVIINAANTVGNNSVCLGMPADPISAGKGVKRVIDLTYTTVPGGIQAIYLWKPLATIVYNGDTTLAREKDFFSQNGFAAPIILDGAYLNLFVQGTNANGGRIFGDFTFIWT